MKLCKMEACQRPVIARGMCSMHYQRWKDHGGVVSSTASSGAPAEFISKAIQYRGTDCYLWPYGKTAGYGSVDVNGHRRRAHRIVCEAVYGPPPFPKADAAHSCGVRACCNPAHLRWDTRKGNMADSLTHGTRLIGARVTGAKLTDAEVVAIRSQLHRPHAELASEYNVSKSNISQIRNRRRWQHLPWTPIPLAENQGNRGRLGETNARAKLTADIVLQIRQSDQSYDALAKRYGVGKTAIAHIRRRLTWRHLP